MKLTLLALLGTILTSHATTVALLATATGEITIRPGHEIVFANPIKPGQEFTYNIVAEDDGYHVISLLQDVDGSRFWTPQDYWRTSWDLESGTTYAAEIQNKHMSRDDFELVAFRVDNVDSQPDLVRGVELTNNPLTAGREGQAFVANADAMAGQGDFG